MSQDQSHSASFRALFKRFQNEWLRLAQRGEVDGWGGAESRLVFSLWLLVRGPAPSVPGFIRLHAHTLSFSPQLN